MTDLDHDSIAKAFHDVVNMTPAELRRWLDTEDSKSVGMHPGGGKVVDAEHGPSVGHQEGARILDVKARKRSELTDDDYAHMRKVVGYVHRHLAQRPEGDVTHTRWRLSLMNWGHDPLKD